MATVSPEPLTTPQAAAAPASSTAAGNALALHVALAALTGFVVTAIWALAGPDYPWPAWVWLGAAITVVLHAIARRVARRPKGPRRLLEAHALVSTVIGLILVMLWALTAGAVFWPVWPLLGLAAAVAVHAVLVALGWLGPPTREEELVERVDELTRTRRGALDVQATELRRIERDLHDGAQARLVALSMQLGRAEEKLGDRPDVAELVRAARVWARLNGETLELEIVDTGGGGADPAGGGLTGLRHRVEAVDGRLEVTSPAGGGTIVRAELPCGS
jgi:signal transduction histidine kinase